MIPIAAKALTMKFPIIILVNLFGHTHQKTNFYNGIPFMYHVGVDSHLCYPVKIERIIEDIKNEIADCLDYL